MYKFIEKERGEITVRMNQLAIIYWIYCRPFRFSDVQMFSFRFTYVCVNYHDQQWEKTGIDWNSIEIDCRIPMLVRVTEKLLHIQCAWTRLAIWLYNNVILCILINYVRNAASTAYTNNETNEEKKNTCNRSDSECNCTTSIFFSFSLSVVGT